MIFFLAMQERYIAARDLILTWGKVNYDKHLSKEKMLEKENNEISKQASKIIIIILYFSNFFF